MRRRGRGARLATIAGAAVLVAAVVVALGGVGARRPPASAAASQPASAPGQPLYRCPMHHEVTAHDPKTRCPRCGMFVNEPAPVVALPDERRQLIGVRRARVERRDLQAEVTAAAVVTADESRVAHVHTKLSGWITRLFVTQTGERVRRGEPLLAIYSEELYRAEGEYLAVRRSLAGVSGDAARAELIAAARRRLRLLDMPNAEIEAIEKSGTPRRDVMLRAPITGVVLARNVTEGSYVEPGTDLFVVADLSRVWTLADIPERQAGEVHVGERTSLRFAAYPGETRDARVAFVYPSVAAETRTVRVRLELANRDLKLKPGMYGEARLRVTVPRALLVPDEAVLPTGTERWVFVIGPGGALDPRRIQVGRHLGTELEVLGGVTAGEEVVASAGFIVDSESALRSALETMRQATPR
jgi:membrane fusion protein, copper/silver efflux system